MHKHTALRFVENAQIPEPVGRPEAALEGPALNLDKLPDGIVSSNTLIDYSAASAEVRGGVSLAMLFASRAATAAMAPGSDEDDWFAAYRNNLEKLGFRSSQTAMTRNRFRKRGLFVHKAIIPFLTIALGGAGVGPVMLALLENLKEVDKDRPWITLFDQESRHFESREMHFAAVSSSQVESVVRHVTARLTVDSSETNVLFFRMTDAAAEFESVTTTLTANNALLAVIEEPLQQRLAENSFAFIKEATLAPR